MGAPTPTSSLTLLALKRSAGEPQLPPREAAAPSTFPRDAKREIAYGSSPRRPLCWPSERSLQATTQMGDRRPVATLGGGARGLEMGPSVTSVQKLFLEVDDGFGGDQTKQAEQQRHG